MAGGVNDVTIAGTIITVFILVGGMIPFISAEFETSSSSNNVDGLKADVGDEVEGSSAVSIFSVFFTIFKMFFWTFGDIPFWLDFAIFTPMRIVLALVIARNTWIGGGG